MDNRINHNTQEELISLRQQLTTLRGHLNSTVEVNARQEAKVNQIRAQLQTTDPSTADFPQTRDWYKQHDSLAMEEDKLEDISKQLHEINKKVSTTESRVNRLSAQAEQQETAPQAPRPENEDPEIGLYAALDVTEVTSANNGPTTEKILLFQLTQSKRQINVLTEERGTLKAKNLLSFKRCAILSREKQLIEKQNFMLRKQRNILQSRLDVLEDQGIDIGKPRNDAEANARVSRRKHRERREYEGLAGAKIFPAQDEAHGGVILETELLDGTDHTVGPALWSPKEKHDIDMLFEEEADITSETDVNQEIHASVPQTFVFGDYTHDDMVYENSEDLIDWTQDDDEYQFSSNPPIAVPAANPPFSPPQTGECRTPEGCQVNGKSFTGLDQKELYNFQRDAALAELEKPWEDLSRPLSPRSSPNRFPPTGPTCEGRLTSLQVEFDAVKEELYETRGELESLRRDFATKSAEGKGARLRIKVLEEEIAERELKELQLREELRLGREEDAWADKLLVELNELRTHFEACAEEKVGVQEKLSSLQIEYEGYKLETEAKVQRLKDQFADAGTAKEKATARVAAFEEAADRGNAYVDELEQKIVVGHGQLNSLTDTLLARDEELKQLNTNLEALKKELELTIEHSYTSQDIGEVLAAKEQDTQRFAAKLQTQTQELERARSDLQGCHSNCQNLKAELSNAGAEIKKLTAQLNEAIEEQDQARNEARDAVAAAEKARDEAVESCRALEASDDTGNGLRSISSENIRELVNIKEERDTAVHNIGRLHRDLGVCRDDVTALKAQLVEVSNERDDLVKENRAVAGRYRDAERRAEEHWKRVLEGITEIERLNTELVGLEEILERVAASSGGNQDQQGENSGQPSSPAAFGIVLVDEEPNSPVMSRPTRKAPTPKSKEPAPRPKSTLKPKQPEPAPLTSSVKSNRSPRLSRNPNPIYTDPPSPSSAAPSPTTPAPFKSDRKRKREVGGPDEVNEKEGEKKRRRK